MCAKKISFRVPPCLVRSAASLRSAALSQVTRTKNKTRVYKRNLYRPEKGLTSCALVLFFLLYTSSALFFCTSRTGMLRTPSILPARSFITPFTSLRSVRRIPGACRRCRSPDVLLLIRQQQRRRPAIPTSAAYFRHLSDSK